MTSYSKLPNGRPSARSHLGEGALCWGKEETYGREGAPEGSRGERKGESWGHLGRLTRGERCVGEGMEKEVGRLRGRKKKN